MFSKYSIGKFLPFRIWSHLNKSNKIKFYFLLILNFLNALAEIISVASLIPFLTILTNPDKISTLPLVGEIFKKSNFTGTTSLLFLVTFAFVSSIILAMLIRVLNLWFNNRLSAEMGSFLSEKCYKNILYQSLKNHQELNSSQVLSAISTYTEYTIIVIMNMLLMITAFLISLFILVFLFTVNFKISLSIFTCLLISYLIVWLTIKKRIKFNSQYIAANTKKQFQMVQESFGAIREIILSSNQLRYLNIYKNILFPLKYKLSENRFLSAFPRYLIESVVLVSIGIISFLLSVNNANGNGVNVIVILGTFVLGLQRLLPSAQQLFYSLVAISSNSSSANNLIDLIEFHKYNSVLPKKLQSNKNFESISFKSVSYSYLKSSNLILNNLNCTIYKGEKIGLIGKTGSGKSTFADIFMGLLPASNGEVLVNNINVNEPKNVLFLNKWRSSIAHVPQDIFLIDASIAENIAFGSTFNKIDFPLLNRILDCTSLRNFVENSDNGLMTSVGERGIKLSGGQKQRIGIARALYRNPDILVLDEATSSLDFHTENEIIKTINKLNKNLTILIIAHKYSSIKKCDRIFRIDKGEIFEISHEDLLSNQ